MSEIDKKEKSPPNDLTDIPPKDVESSGKKLKYPRAIPFIISNEFCERFNFYGMKAILVLYLTRKLLYDDDTATVLYHTFNSLVYFFCIFGAIIADSWWGKYKTILWLSIVYVAGSTVIAIGAIEPWNLPARALTILGLFLIALGSGGIKPCVAAFGGEQFKMPEQAAQLAVFFSLFYFSINAGSLISTTVTPILREDVQCFGMDDCFPLAFGVPAVLMFIAVLIFVGGKFLYRILPNEGNMLVKVFSCIGSALKLRKREKRTNPKDYWLEYAESTHGKKLVMETKILLNVLVLYLPLPVFWALFDQQGSRWTFQATRMNGDLGFWELKPDQMQVINPLLILIFIPLYEVVFYPLLNLIGIRRPLQKLTIGGILAGIAFVISAIVEINLSQTYAVIPGNGEAQLRIFNGRNCNYGFSSNIPEHSTFSINAMKHFEDEYVKVNGDENSFQIKIESATPAACEDDVGYEINFKLSEEMAHSFFLKGTQGDRVSYEEFEDNPEKSRRGWPMIRILANIRDPNAEIIFLEKGRDERFRGNSGTTTTNQFDVPSNIYEVMINDQSILIDLELKLGGVYLLMIDERELNEFTTNLEVITDPNSMSMLWLIPQYVVITLGEVMFSITGLQFSFTQAPASMKSVLQGCWMLTVAFGNLIVVIIAGARFFESQTYEFFLFAGLMFVDMAVFMWLAYRYKAIPLEELEKLDDELLKNEEKASPLEFKAANDNYGLDNKE